MPDGKIIFQYVGDTSGIDSANDTAEAKAKAGADKLGAVTKKSALVIGAALTAATVAAFKFGTAFETSMAGASTLFGDTNVNMDALKGKMLDLSDSTGIAADQLGNTLYNALSAGVPVSEDMGDALTFIEKSAKLAKGGFTDVDTAMSTTIKTMNAYNMDMSETDRVQKILMQTQNEGIVTVGELGSVLAQVTPTAAAMGVSFEQVGASIAVMTSQGTPAAQATTQLNQLIAELGKSGTTASKGFEAATAGTEYAGKSFQQLMADGVPLNTILDLMGGYADKNGLSMIDMFSSIEAGKAALAISGENAQSYTDALEAMGTEADVVSDAASKIDATAAEKFDKVLNYLKNTAINLYENALKPMIAVLYDIATWLVEHKDAATVIAIGIGALTVAIIAYNIQQALLASGMTIATIAGTAFGAVLSFITSPITLIILGVAALIAIIVLLVKHWDEVSAWLKETWTAIKDKAVEVWTAIKDFFIGIWTAIKDFVVSIFTSIKDFFVTVWTAIKDFFINLWTGIKETVMSVITGLKTGMTGVFEGIASSIKTKIQNIKDIFSNIIDFIKNVFTGNWKGAWQNIKNIFGTIWDGMKSIFKTPINWIIDKLNTFLGGINKIKIPDWVPGVGGKGINIPLIPRLKKGMDFVPKDMFPAFLDYGERVLTQEQNLKLNAIGGIKGLDSIYSGISPASLAGNNNNTTIHYEIPISGNTLLSDDQAVINAIGAGVIEMIKRKGAL